MSNVDIDDTLYNEICKYCSMNDIEDVNGFIDKLLRTGFNIEKYGELNPKKTTTEKTDKEENKQPNQDYEMRKDDPDYNEDYDVFDN